MEPLGDAERGRLFTAMLEYAKTGAVADLKGNERFVFATVKMNIDAQRDSYDKQCETNKRIATNRNEASRTVTNRDEPSQDQDQEKTKKRPRKETIPPKHLTVFTPPSVEEVSDYCRERGNSVNATRFVDFYSMKGWMVGKNKMKDWKAAVRTWERNDKASTLPDYDSMEDLPC